MLPLPSQQNRVGRPDCKCIMYEDTIIWYIKILFCNVIMSKFWILKACDNRRRKLWWGWWWLRYWKTEFPSCGLDMIGWLPNPSLIALHLRRLAYIFRCAQSPVVEFWVQNSSFSLDPMVFLNLPVSYFFFFSCCSFSNNKRNSSGGPLPLSKGAGASTSSPTSTSLWSSWHSLLQVALDFGGGQC